MNGGARSGLLALAGGYVLYLAWEMFTDLRNGKNGMEPAIAITFIAFFTLAGIAVVVYAALVWNKSRKEEKEGKTEEKKETNGLK